MLLVCAPFGLLPYFPALVIWTVLGLAAFVAALRLWTPDWRLILPLCGAPAAIFGLISGQFAFFGAALVLAVLRWREQRPWLAGALLGLLCVKPQLGLLLPVLLIATRNWRAFAAAALTVLALAGVTIGLWGIGIWRVYLLSGIANQSLVLSDPEHLAGPFMPTLFMNLRTAGASVQLAGMGQALLSVLALLVTIAGLSRDRAKRPDRRHHHPGLGHAQPGGEAGALRRRRRQDRRDRDAPGGRADHPRPNERADWSFGNGVASYVRTPAG